MNTQAKPKTDICVVTVFRVRSTNEGFSIYQATASVGPKLALTVKQFVGPVHEGQRWVICGQEVRDPKWGDQFAAVYATLAAPTTLKELELFLTSGLLEGWDWRGYQELVRAFGADGVLHACETGQYLGLESAVITDEAKQVLLESWHRGDTLATVYAQLAEWGVTGRTADALVKHYGAVATDKLAEDPYRAIADVSGYGWRTAELIASHVGILPRDDRRLAAGLALAVTNGTFTAGHTWLTPHEATKTASGLLGQPYSVVRELLDSAIAEGRITAEGEKLFPPGLYTAEQTIAAQLEARVNRPGLVNLQRTAGMFEGTQLGALQLEAVLKGLTEPISLLTGGPGTGTTTCLKTLVETAVTLGLQVTCMAPTGKAAARMAEATGYPASTIHSKLRLLPGETGPMPYGEPLAGLVIVDEISMLDTQLAAAMLQRISLGAQLVLVGDPDQLPSVGPGAVLRDLLAADVLPRTHLSHVYRNEAGIAQNAARMREAKELYHFPDCQLLGAASDTEAMAIMLRLLDELQAEGYTSDQILILTPKNDGGTGRFTLNTLLQTRFNDHPAGTGITKYLGTSEDPDGTLAKRMEELRTGDRVMVTRNSRDLGVFNGQVGTVLDVDVPRALEVDIDGEQIRFAGDEKRSLTLAYAITGHKAQGSEAPIVLSPIFPSRVLCREWLYTVLTRAKERCYFIGDIGALQAAIQLQRASERRTGLVGQIETAFFIEGDRGVI